MFQCAVLCKCQGIIGCTPISLPMGINCVLWGFLAIITHKFPLYRAYTRISHRGMLGYGYIQLSPDNETTKTRRQPCFSSTGQVAWTAALSQVLGDEAYLLPKHHLWIKITHETVQNICYMPILINYERWLVFHFVFFNLKVEKVKGFTCSVLQAATELTFVVQIANQGPNWSMTKVLRFYPRSRWPTKTSGSCQTTLGLVGGLGFLFGSGMRGYDGICSLGPRGKKYRNWLVCSINWVGWKLEQVGYTKQWRNLKLNNIHTPEKLTWIIQNDAILDRRCI